MSDETQVCSCNNLTKDAICAAIAEGKYKTPCQAPQTVERERGVFRLFNANSFE